MGTNNGPLPGIDYGSLSYIDNDSLLGIEHFSLSSIDNGSLSGLDDGFMLGIDTGSSSGIDNGRHENRCRRTDAVCGNFGVFSKCFVNITAFPPILELLATEISHIHVNNNQLNFHKWCKNYSCMFTTVSVKEISTK